MSASVHHARIFRCVLCIRIFGDRERIHIEAQQNSGARFRAFEEPYHASFPNAFGHFNAKNFEFLGDNSARADFFESKLRVNVKIAAHGLCVRK